MRNNVTVTQTFPSLAAANAVRERLAEGRGFDRYEELPVVTDTTST